ncbi:hypothetical protein NPA08_01845 [Mycoplasmopsis citelli]|uniref:hypothetical protein n=1 Tax=Mycoplasmopsis citelli TaxID=171281 RepID=UPI002113CAF3|nr:hypothetical protein [Mycoplasmopsis citelli]UUD36555.1 hypothetical protein NPA08_01845 [Mycoplasmopsis citelli]
MELVYKLYARKQDTYYVNKVFPNIKIDRLDLSLIDKLKKEAVNRNENHPWKNMSYEEFLRSLKLILEHPQTGKEGISLATILLFGKKATIMSVLPQYKNDAIFRVVNKNRYDDRKVITTNLIESYYKLMDFGKKHLNDLFILDGIFRVDARSKILREIVSNTLTHRDYSSVYPVRMIIDDEKITVENSDLSHLMGQLDLNNFKPIAKVFREIGFADELGSGMRNTYKYTRLYSWADPIFEEGDVFITIIPLKKIATLKVGENVPQKREIYLIELIKEKIKENNQITRQEIAIHAGVTVETIWRIIKKIDNLEYIGSSKKGYWKLNE